MTSKPKAGEDARKDAFMSARTLADCARIIGQPEKSFRGWVRRNTGTFVSGKRGDAHATFTPEQREQAWAHYMTTPEATPEA